MLLPLLLSVLVVVIAWWLRSTRLPSNFPPGPPFTLPLVGSLPFLGTQAQKGLRHLRQKHGDVYHVYLGARLAVVLNTYDLVKEAFSKDEYADRSELTFWGLWRGGLSMDGSPPGVIQSSGQTWAEQRRFALSTLRDLGYGGRSMEDMIEDEVRNFLDDLNPSNDPEGAVVTVDETLFNASVLSSLWRIVSGERLSDAANQAKLRRLLKLVSDLMAEYVSPKVQALITHDWLFLLAAALGLTSLKRTMDDLLEFVSESIEAHKSTFQEDHIRDFIDAYLMKARETQSPNTSFSADHYELNLRNVLVDLFMAGSDTTAATLRWATLFLAKNQEVQKKVQEELDLVVGRSAQPKLNNRHMLQYTEATIHEIQRRANIAHAAISHYTNKDVEIGGFSIPRGTTVFSNLSEIMLEEKDFPDAFKFMPERFLDDQGKFVPHPKNVPFGYGKRRCLGENLARAQIFYFVTGMLHKFDLIPVEVKEMSEDPVMGVALTPKPFKIRFKQRLYLE